MSPEILGKILKVPLINVLVLCSKQEELLVLDYFIASIEDKEWISKLATKPHVHVYLANGTTIRILSDPLLTKGQVPDLLFYTDSIHPKMYNQLVLLRNVCTAKTLRLKYKEEENNV